MWVTGVVIRPLSILVRLEPLMVIVIVIRGLLVGVVVMNYVTPGWLLLALVAFAPLLMPIFGTWVPELAFEPIILITTFTSPVVPRRATVCLHRWGRARDRMARLGVRIRPIRHGHTATLLPVTDVAITVTRRSAECMLNRLTVSTVARVLLGLLGKCDAVVATGMLKDRLNLNPLVRECRVLVLSLPFKEVNVAP